MDWWAEIEPASSQPLQQTLIHRGTQMRARIHPRIVDACGVPVESADLCFEDGSTALGVPYAAFTFAD
jgi:hypothetical protein